MFHIAGAFCGMDHACAGAGLGEDFAREFVDRDLATVAGIEDARDAGSFGGKGERAAAKPWEGAEGLEWEMPSPAPYHTHTTPPEIK